MIADSSPAPIPARLAAAPEQGPTVSFELFPPRSAAGEASLWAAIARLAEAAPDFISVTYGASGSSRDTSRAVVRHVLEHTQVRPVAHLTCIASERSELRTIAEGFLADGVRDVLALRGDPPAGAEPWVPPVDGLSRASELVAFLREIDPAVAIGVAATPSCLPAVPEPDAPLCGDLLALRAKQDAGAQYAITQVFFEADSYRRYVAAARAAGVDLPIIPGIVPLEDPARLRRLQEISGVPVPGALLDRLDSETDEQRRRAAGLELGAELVSEVLEAGAPGLHLYTFNQSRASIALLDRLGLRSGAA
ncbi:methylenetetrahydrofolate reductase [Actinotalea sp.]|uniref:methylenetetrahydrofolate reductase n=1 Tax=Actinotalea sp. TaxID=1872145 RepID=UPI003561A42D